MWNWLEKRVKLIVCVTMIAGSVEAQLNKDGNAFFYDSLDKAFDLSNFILDVHGFVPVPFIITEPALGGFGGGVALVFIKRHEAFVDTTAGRRNVRPIPPNVTGVGGMYTINDSWGLMAFRSATWVKPRIKYKALGGYANVNLSFYRENSQGEETRYGFNIKTFPAFVSLQRILRYSSWSAGVQYLFLRTEVNLLAEELPSFATETEWTADVSRPGLVVEMDNRDNIFTPDKGLKIHTSVGWSDAAFGSDHDYVNLNAFVYSYIPLSHSIVGGLRFDIRKVFDDPPFYLLPFIELRGIPTARYQSNITSVAEAEVRWDVVRRWSLVLFGGTGKAFEEWNTFDDTGWISSGGAGFRYLVARKFKLRMGVDLARGPEQWAYYIIMGSAWLR